MTIPFTYYSSMNHIKTQSNHVSELQSHLGFWLRFVSNHVSASFQKKVEANGISISEWVVLRYLYNGGVLSSLKLIDALGMTKGAISKILGRLERKNLIKRITSEEDKRAQKIMLTANGRKLVPKLAEIADQNEAKFFGHLTEYEYTELIQIMKKVVHIHGLKHLPID